MWEIFLWLYPSYTQSSPSKNKSINYIFIYLRVFRCLSSGTICDTYLITLSVKQGGIKYQFVSLWYDSTWNWTPVFRSIGNHSTPKERVGLPVRIHRFSEVEAQRQMYFSFMSIFFFFFFGGDEVLLLCREYSQHILTPIDKEIPSRVHNEISVSHLYLSPIIIYTVLLDWSANLRNTSPSPVNNWK